MIETSYAPNKPLICIVTAVQTLLRKNPKRVHVCNLCSEHHIHWNMLVKKRVFSSCLACSDTVRLITQSLG